MNVLSGDMLGMPRSAHAFVPASAPCLQAHWRGATVARQQAGRESRLQERRGHQRDAPSARAARLEDGVSVVAGVVDGLDMQESEAVAAARQRRGHRRRLRVQLRAVVACAAVPPLSDATLLPGARAARRSRQHPRSEPRREGSCARLRPGGRCCCSM